MIFNFVIDCSDHDLNKYTHISLEAAPYLSANGMFSWCLQSYLILGKRGAITVMCSNKLQQDVINIIHSDQLLKLKGTANHFIVCVQADFPRRSWAQYHLVQNKNQVLANSTFIPHWLQPGLIGRNPSRAGVVKAAYAGQIYNGNLAFSEEKWKLFFIELGIDFVTLSAENWHNLSEVDVLIGIRSFNNYAYNNKPPSKLFNAWHAQIPFIGGYDSAYQQVGAPGIDYVRVKSWLEIREAMVKLQEDKCFYSTLIQNGNKKKRRI